MKKGLSWFVGIMGLFAIPYTWSEDIASSFIATIYFIIVIYLAILNIKEK